MVQEYAIGDGICWFVLRSKQFDAKHPQKVGTYGGGDGSYVYWYEMPCPAVIFLFCKNACIYCRRIRL